MTSMLPPVAGGAAKDSMVVDEITIPSVVSVAVKVNVSAVVSVRVKTAVPFDTDVTALLGVITAVPPAALRAIVLPLTMSPELSKVWTIR